MKKNKIFYIFFIVMVLFCFTTDVYAAQELTCIYEKGKNHNGSISKVVLVQTKNATRFVYKNKDDVSLSEAGWEDKTDDGIYFDSSIKLSDDNGLTECPKSKSTSDSWFSSAVTFYGNDSGNQSLEKNGEYFSVQPIANLTIDNGSSSNTPTSVCKEKEDWLSDDNSALRCLYKSSDLLKTKCSVVQIGLSNSSDPFIKTSWFTDSAGNSGIITTDSSFDVEEVKKITNGKGICPQLLYVNTYFDPMIEMNELNLTFSYKKSYSVFRLQENAGYDLVKGEATDNTAADFNFDISFNEIPSATTCKELFGNDETLIDLLSTFINVIKILVPIILLVLGSLDFAQAVFSANEDGIKKAQQKFIKRLIIAAVIFLIPSILKILLTLANQIWDNIDPDLCGLI